MTHVTDTFDRPLASLRLSVTDRCNLRCSYCMPEEEYAWLPKGNILTFEEITRLASVFVGLGTKKLRLTGGEPLLRRDLHVLIAALDGLEGVEEIALTTNGVHLAKSIDRLRDAGLDRITVSLDTLDRNRFIALARRDALADTLEGIRSVRAAGFSDLKLDTVVVRGKNDDEIPDLLAFADSVDAEIRFIEYMDVGGATGWRMEDVVSRAEILGIVERRFGPVAPAEKTPRAPADRFRLPSGRTFGVIASTTTPFCDACDRARLTADGRFFMCLYALAGLDLLSVLRGGADDGTLAEIIGKTWRGRFDRGAIERLRLRDRGALAPAVALRTNPHLEMHTRGG